MADACLQFMAGADSAAVVVAVASADASADPGTEFKPHTRPFPLSYPGPDLSAHSKPHPGPNI